MGKHDDAKRTYEQARQRLAKLPRNASESEYLKANKAVEDASRRLPWHRR
jgi:hypothetical protein